MKKFYLLIISFTLLYFQSNAQLVVFNGSYATGVSFAPFGGSVNNIAIDPTNLYNGNASLEVVVPASGYTGGALVTSTPLNVTAYNAVTFWAKASVDTTIDVTGFGNSSSSTAYAAEYDGAVRLNGTWKKFIIPIPDASKLTYLSGLFHFAQGSQYGAFNFWLADIQYENLSGGVIGTPTASLATETLTETIGSVFTASGIAISFPVNGITETLSNVAPVYFTYSQSTPGIVSFDTLGNITAVAAGSTNVTAKLVTTTVTGSITVNVTSLTAPITPAPTPTIPPAQVISLFNSMHVYTNNPVDDWLATWCNAKITDPFLIGTDSIKEFYNLVYSGSEFITHEVNATTNHYFHIDVWTPNIQSLSVKLVDFYPSGAYNGSTNQAGIVTFSPVQGQWNSLVINLDSVAGLTDYTYMAQLLLVDNDNGGAGGGSVYFDNVYFSSVRTALPVHFLSFNGVLQNNAAVLNWSTASEINNKGFEVERSSDGQSFSDIGFLAGNGTTNRISNYTYSDPKLVSGNNYYRLKQIDLDGNYNYSSVIKLEFNNFGWSILGNPSNNTSVQLQLDKQYNNVSLQVVSLSGKVIQTINKGSLGQGTYSILLNINNAASGMYIVKLLVDGNEYSKNMLH